MKKNSRGRDVSEKQLFHGTDSKFVDTICLNNFDWRICGVNGTAYGKGEARRIVKIVIRLRLTMGVQLSYNKDNIDTQGVLESRKEELLCETLYLCGV